MEITFSMAPPYGDPTQAPKDDVPDLRFFRISFNFSHKNPVEDIKTVDALQTGGDRTGGAKGNYRATKPWRPMTAANAPKANVVGYYFGRKLQTTLKIPIGIIDNSAGGSKLHTWFTHYCPVGNKTSFTLADTTDLKILKYTNEALSNQLDNYGAYYPGIYYYGHNFPIMGFPFVGAIWWQGEFNVGTGEALYEKLFTALIRDWRKTWGQGDFPFYFVQLPPADYGADPLKLPELREAQAATLVLPNTGMAVTIDIGSYPDCHAPNKQDVGKRLALSGLAKVYGRGNLVYSGPLYKSMSVEGGKVRIRFDHIGGGLAARDGNAKELTWFEIAGADRKFVKAGAQIDGETVLVSNDAVAQPAAVRFGWHQQAVPNLMNKEGLPAAPFRTDDLPR
jgi:sialate O-acetylesterase